MTLYYFNVTLSFLITISPAIWLYYITRNNPDAFPKALVSAWLLSIVVIFFTTLT